jgi:hypothetical protein
MQAIKKAIGGCEFSFVSLVVGLAIAQRFFAEHRLGGEDDIKIGPEQHGHHVTAVILGALVPVRALDLAGQAARAVPLIGGVRPKPIRQVAQSSILRSRKRG